MKSLVHGLLVVMLANVFASAAGAADWPQWRGPNRDGISSEMGLLKQWPAGGPKLLWQAKNLGSGYSTPAVVGGRIYLLANNGNENESAKALDAKDGSPIWSVRLGKVGNPKQQPSFPAARLTPTVDGDVLYALGSDGDLACMRLTNGDIVWQKSLRSDFGGKPGEWAYSESPLVDGDLVICTPGAADAAIVALNKKTGDIVWKSAIPGGGGAAYASAIAIDVGGSRQYVQLLEKGLVGIDAKTGKLSWRYEKPTSVYGANIPTPVASGGFVYAGSAGTGGGAVKLVQKDGNVESEPAYFDPKLPAAIGGSVVIGDHLYGSGGQVLLCVEFKTGKVIWTNRSVAPGSLCFADGHLYLQGENGEVALIEVTPAGYREHGRFTPPARPARSNGMEKSWTYPVISDGRLYIRDHGSLWCYDVRETAGAK